MGDIAGDFFHAGHQAFNLAQHVVEGLGEAVQFIARAFDRHALGKIACHDVAAGFVDGVNAAQETAAYQIAAAQPQDHCKAQRPIQRILDQRTEGPEFLHIAAHQQLIAA